ncbi:uncharacterized protein J3R85_019500 [Psidium guajava]|nr:uncharacterized protein J3R85_019500 [Psidium guajava]
MRPSSHPASDGLHEEAAAVQRCAVPCRPPHPATSAKSTPTLVVVVVVVFATAAVHSSAAPLGFGSSGCFRLATGGQRGIVGSFATVVGSFGFEEVGSRFRVLRLTAAVSSPPTIRRRFGREAISAAMSGDVAREAHP